MYAGKIYSIKLSLFNSVKLADEKTLDHSLGRP